MPLLDIPFSMIQKNCKTQGIIRSTGHGLFRNYVTDNTLKLKINPSTLSILRHKKVLERCVQNLEYMYKIWSEINVVKKLTKKNRES